MHCKQIPMWSDGSDLPLWSVSDEPMPPAFVVPEQADIAVEIDEPQAKQLDIDALLAQATTLHTQEIEPS